MWTGFSGYVHFVPLQKLPSAAGTGNLLVQQVFRLHGILKDIVLDRGPQFTSGVWKFFCSALGATVSLSSGYHPLVQWPNRAHEPVAGEHSPVRGGPATFHLEHLPALGGIRPKFAGLVILWCLSLRGDLGLSTTCLTTRGRRRRSLPFEPTYAGVRVWRQVRASLLHSSSRFQAQSNRRRVPSPRYRPGQWVWLLAKDLPLRMECRKLVPRWVHSRFTGWSTQQRSVLSSRLP